MIKQIVGDATADGRYERELTALQLAGRVRPPVVPALLHADAASRSFVLERLDTDAPDRDWPVRWAAALARLHSATSALDIRSLPAWQGPTAADVDAFLRLASALQVAPPKGAGDELQRVVSRLSASGQHALLHGDPCPPNDLYGGEGVRFVDLEQASLGNGLVELAYLRIGFPTCWCVTAVPPSVLSRAEAAYRSAWTANSELPLPADLGPGLTDAGIGWLLRGDALVQAAHRHSVDHLSRLVLEDWDWGTATARQRFKHRLAVVAAAAAGRSDLKAVQHLTTDLSVTVAKRWPRTGAVPTTGGSHTRTALDDAAPQAQAGRR